ncbi:hypothetical protein MXB_4044, partial [Myxobolus squamalis]
MEEINVPRNKTIKLEKTETIKKLSYEEVSLNSIGKIGEFVSSAYNFCSYNLEWMKKQEDEIEKLKDAVAGVEFNNEYAIELHGRRLISSHATPVAHSSYQYYNFPVKYEFLRDNISISFNGTNAKKLCTTQISERVIRNLLEGHSVWSETQIEKPNNSFKTALKTKIYYFSEPSQPYYQLDQIQLNFEFPLQAKIRVISSHSYTEQQTNNKTSWSFNKKFAIGQEFSKSNVKMVKSTKIQKGKKDKAYVVNDSPIHAHLFK